MKEGAYRGVVCTLLYHLSLDAEHHAAFEEAMPTIVKLFLLAPSGALLPQLMGLAANLSQNPEFALVRRFCPMSKPCLSPVRSLKESSTQCMITFG